MGKPVASEWDTQPKGYNNTIRWNAGHVFVSMEYFVSSVIADYEMVHPSFTRSFLVCTKETFLCEGCMQHNDVQASNKLVECSEIIRYRRFIHE